MNINKLRRRVNQLQRRARGAALALMAALLVVLAGIIVFTMNLLGLFGGARQLQNTTDSGNLNVARSATTQIGVSLQDAAETNNFSAFLNGNGQVDLVQFNKVVGQCVWVALNAEAENTAAATANCQAVVNAAEGGSSSIAARLCTTLSDSSQTSPLFSALANDNSVALLGNSKIQPDSNGFTVGFMNPDGLTNVTLDSTNAPVQAASGTPVQVPSALLSSQKSSSSGFPYIAGYEPISFNQNNLGVTLSGVSVQPSQSPHLVANSDLNSATKQPVSSLVLPPNAFQSVAIMNDTVISGHGSSAANPLSIKMTSSSLIGTLNQQATASIPYGFIIINNGSGDSDSSPQPSNESIFNNQLFTGIFIANNGVFSTDESQIQAWADFNAAGGLGQAPPTDGMFGPDGSAVSGQQYKITQLGGNGYPVMADYTNVQGPNAVSAAAAMLPAFETAYPAPNSNGSSGCILTAVEKLNAEVGELFTTGQGGAPATVSKTGMRYFNHASTYVLAKGQSPEFTRPGNIVELANMAGQLANNTSINNNNLIIASLEQRMREMKPTATASEMNEVLTGNTLNLNTTFYLWLDTTNTFRLTQSAPQWGTVTANTSLTPDGSPQLLATNFPTIGLSVDPVGEYGFNQSLFGVQPNPQTEYLGVDSATWTPSTGASNLLGTLSFNESISGTSSTVAPPTPTPVPTPPPTNPCANDSSYLPAIQNYINAVVNDVVNAYGTSTFGRFLDALYIYSIGSNYDGALTQVQNHIIQLGDGHVTSVSFHYHEGDYSTNYFQVVVTTECGNESASQGFWYNN